MEARPAQAEAVPHTGPLATATPAAWTRPLVKIDALWTKIETYLVLFVLIGAILYMTGWVTLNAFHTKAGKLAKFPGLILTFAGLASATSWTRLPIAERKPKKLIVSGVLFVFGVLLLAVAGKQDYFANISRWLSDASIIKQIGTPQIVSSRLFTIWVALLGGSLATGAGRQINIDVVMRFIGPKPRLAVALFGYLMSAIACFVISWGFLDYLAITRYGAQKLTPAKEKLSVVAQAVGRHTFLVRRQAVLDLRSFGKVVIGGQPYDKWYSSAEWNEELNTAGWASTYPPLAPAAGTPPPATPYPTKPCLSAKEMEELSAKGGTVNPDWRLVGSCDLAEGGMRAPLATAPEPDDRTPLEADLSLLFPWGFLMIGLRFILRGILAFGGAVSTDPNAAHGADAPMHGPLDEDVAHEPPIVERRVDQEAKAHEGAGALPPDDVNVRDALGAAHAKVEAKTSDADHAAKGLGGERPHHDVKSELPPVDNAVTKRVAAVDVPDRETTKQKVAEEQPPPRPSKPPSSIPPEGIPTAQRLEIAEQIAQEEEDERTLVGDLSELARAQELIEAQRIEKAEEKKKGGKG